MTLRTAPSRERLLSVLVLSIAVVSGVRTLGGSGDFKGYVEVGGLVLQGRDIYAESRFNTWPPFFSLICVPLAYVAEHNIYLARGLWTGLSLLFLYFALRMMVALTYGQILRVVPGKKPGFSLGSPQVVVPLLLTARFLSSTLKLLQINMIILGLTVACWYFHRRGRDWLGGGALGLAVAIKVFPAGFLLYFAYKKQTKILLATLCTVVLLSLSPVGVFGPRDFFSYAQQWLAISSGGWPVRDTNQSLWAMVQRFVVYGVSPLNACQDVWRSHRYDLVAVAQPLASLIGFSLIGVITAMTALLFRRAGAEPLVEFAIVSICAVLFSPLAWKHYFVMLLIPYMVAHRYLWETESLMTRDRCRARVLVVLSFIGTTLTAPGFVGKKGNLCLEMLSCVTWGALFLLAALLLVRYRVGGNRENEGRSS